MPQEGSYAFFLGCITPNRYPQIEKATRYVFEKLGVELVDMERAACCPAPGVFRSFNKVDWMVAAARNLCVAEKLDRDVLTVCNGCFGTLQDVNKALKEDEDLRERVNERLRELWGIEFQGTIEVHHVAELLAWDFADDVEENLVRRVRARAAIHYGCHFLKPTRHRELDSSENPTMLEEYFAMLGVESLDFKDKLTCCGAGGGIKAAHPDASMTIFAEKMKNISEVRPDFILDICPFCHLQFETGQKFLNDNRGTAYDLPVIHISQLTAYCMGMDQNFVGLQYQLMGRDYVFGDQEEVA
ncbi:MAG: CoB--CoM heterodisulfide reductase subunit B [Promethearchaeota archaeon]